MPERLEKVNMTVVRFAGSLKSFETFLQMQVHRLYAIIDAYTVLV